MKCDIIIPIWNQRKITEDCIASIVRNTVYPYRLILIDNSSDDETRRYLEAVRDKKPLDVTLIRNPENLGFVKAVNQGLKVSSSPYVCVFNNDTVTSPGWLEEMVEFAEAHEDIGIVNPQCSGHKDAAIDEHARILARDHKAKYMEMNQCFLFCALIKREVIDTIGGLAEVFGVGCFDDTDFSMRAGLAGYRCACLHSAYVYHIQEVSFKALGDRKGIVAKCEKEFFRKWPRHLRIGMAFSLSDRVTDKEAANLLNAALFLAREWCWINLWIFGDEERNGRRVAEIAESIGMPLHQNIKFNMLADKHKAAHVLIRLIERSFGTKKRKRYDVILSDDAGLSSLLNAFRFLHHTDTRPIDLKRDARPEMAGLVKELRGRR